MNDTDKAEKTELADPREETTALERKADAIRRDVDRLLAEADQRRQRFWGLRTKLRESPALVVGAACVLGVATVTVSLLLVRRFQRPISLQTRLSTLGDAVKRVARRSDGLGRAAGSPIS